MDLLVYPQKPSVFEMLANPLGTSASGVSLMGVLLGRPEARVIEQHVPALFRFRRGEMLALMPNIFLR